MSSLPTSDGFDHLAHPSGQSSEIGNHTSVPRSVSTSVCPVKPSDAAGLDRQADKALKVSAEFQIASEEREHLLPLQGLSAHASSADTASADQRPPRPLQNSLEQTVVTDTLKKSPAEKSTPSHEFHLCTKRETSLSITATRVCDPQMFLHQKGWHPEYQNQSLVNGFQQHEEARNQQHEVVQQNAPCDQAHLCSTGTLDPPGQRQQSQPKRVDLEAEMKGDELQQNVDLQGAGKNVLNRGYLGCSSSETLMDVDVVEQSLVAVFNSGGCPNAKSIDASHLILDNPSMEVEISKYNPSSEILTNSISTQDLRGPESKVDISRTNEEDSSCSPLSLCGSGHTSVETTEESCSSITTALKELHELLVISSNPASENIYEDTFCPSGTGAKGQISTNDLPEIWAHSEPLPTSLDEQCPPGFSHQSVPVSTKTEKLGTSPDTGMENINDINFRGPVEGVPKLRESTDESSSSSVPQASMEMSNQLHRTLGVEISPKLLTGEGNALNQICEQTESLPSSFLLVKDSGQGIPNPVTEKPESRENTCPEAAGPFLEFEPPTSHPSNPSIFPPLIFPAADIERILRAGFTLQEALGALHRVGGNVDLALLVLLAKNIVVPT
ncbi:PREDICTED: regulatory solute carrier protein family 1 member 1 [Elephantulus edwardii]|uniref:regulatory solute carrier protein family 1 member 1 n=1 Tax=Elephantulus edwardii TaxID=28737 RepID=UPI0003F0A726|nr:PREDICTED: regulatory solute carrier protein family 1 member 1 [Elephantulus edwardii]